MQTENALIQRIGCGRAALPSSGHSEFPDVSPLEEATTLWEISLWPQARNLEFLRPVPKFEHISYQKDLNWRPAKTAEDFWRDYDEKKGTAARQP